MNIQLLHKALRCTRTTLAMLFPVPRASHREMQSAWQPVPVQTDEATHRQAYLHRQARHRTRGY